MIDVALDLPDDLVARPGDLPERVVDVRLGDHRVDHLRRRFLEVPLATERLLVDLPDVSHLLGSDGSDLDAVGQLQVGDVVEVGPDQRRAPLDGLVPARLEPSGFARRGEIRPGMCGERSVASRGPRREPLRHVGLLGIGDRVEDRARQVVGVDRREQVAVDRAVLVLAPADPAVADDRVLELEHGDVPIGVAVGQMGVRGVELLDRRVLRIAEVLAIRDQRAHHVRVIVTPVVGACGVPRRELHAVREMHVVTVDVAGPWARGCFAAVSRLRPRSPRRGV